MRLGDSLLLLRCHMLVGKYLSYDQYGRKYPGRVKLQSASAKRPMTWELSNHSGNRVSLTAVRMELRILV